MSDYTFIRINQSLYPKIKELYIQSFSLYETNQYIENKYDTSMFGLRDIGVMALASDNAPAAYYGAFPITLSYHGSDILAAQSGDTMTSPLHQKKGLFTQLAQATYKLAEEQNIKLVYGFPNENSYPGFKNKLDWQFTGLLQNYSLINTAIPFCELAYKYKTFEKLYRPYVNMRIAKYKLPVNDENISKLNTETCGVKKSLQFFEYKMKSPDIYLVKINGFSLLIKVNNHLQIGAVGKFEQSKLPSFISTIKGLGNMLGCRRTIFSMSKNYWLNDFLLTSLPASDSMSIGFYVIDKSIKIEDFAFTLADFDTF